MRASFRQASPAGTDADTLCVGLFEGEQPPTDVDQALDGRLSRLVESGEAKGSFKKIALLHPEGAIAPARVLIVGLGKRDEFTLERARIAAAVALGRARDAGAKRIAWAVPDGTRRGLDGAGADRRHIACRLPVRSLQELQER